MPQLYKPGPSVKAFNLILAALLAIALSMIVCCDAKASGPRVIRSVSGGSCQINPFTGKKVCAQPVIQHHAAPVVSHHAVTAPVVKHHAAAVVQEHVVAQPVTKVGVQNVWYGVGQPVVQQAMMTRAMTEALNQYKFQAEVTANINGTVTGTSSGTTAPAAGFNSGHYGLPAAPVPTPGVPGTPQFSFTAPASLGPTLNASCAKCHAGDAKQGSFQFATATPATLAKAIKRVADGTMPPAGELSSQEKASALSEIAAIIATR